MRYRVPHVRPATGLVASLALFLMILHGCTAGGAGTGHADGTVIVIAEPTANGPVAVSPDSVASRAVLANLSMLLPSTGVSDLALSIAASDVMVQVSDPGTTTDPVSVLVVSMQFAAADAPDPCADSVGPAVTFLVTIDASGRVTNVEPPSVSLDPQTIGLLLAGEVSLCTTLEADFAGSVRISGVNATIPPSGSTNSNSSGAGNVNGNDNAFVGGNVNANTNVNDNASSNHNDNSSLNGNDNGYDDDDDDDDGNDNTATGVGTQNVNQNSGSSNHNANDNGNRNDNDDDDDDADDDHDNDND
jgi:hypothetical protein